MIVAIWRNLWGLSVGKRSTSSFKFSSRYYKDVVNLFCAPWACLAMHSQSDTINLYKTFVFICTQKISFIQHAFLRTLQRYANFLLLIFWVCLITHTQNDSIKLVEDITFIIHFFLEILDFKEFCNLIGWQHFGS